MTSAKRRAAATAKDFFVLLKPKVMSLVIFTGLAGLVVAPGHVPFSIAAIALACIAVGAGGSGALNMAYEADIDALMARTAGRPVPRRAVTRRQALIFGWTLSIGAVVVMAARVNLLAAGLLAFTILWYVGVYTLGLKRLTPQNIVIGGLSGAMPPAVGWAAVSGTLTWQPLLLVAIIFFWTPPHFWALALFASGDYDRAGVPMLPVVAGKRATRHHILVYALLLVSLGLAPAATGLGGPLYLAVAALLGAVLLQRAVAVVAETDAVREPAARRLFAVTILYLFALFAALILERLSGLVGR